MSAYYDYRGVPAGGPAVGARTVGAWLAERDDDWLAALLAARTDLAVPSAPTDFAALGTRASSYPSLVAAREQLDDFSLQLLDALCLLPEQTDVAALHAVLGQQIDRGDVERGLSVVVDLALAFRAGAEVFAHPAIRVLATYPAHLGPPLAEALTRRSVADVTRLAQAIGAPIQRTRAATLESVAVTLSDRATVERLLMAGPKGTEAMARRLAAEGPAIAAPHALYSPPEHTPLGYLIGRGLLVVVSWDYAVMPREVAVALRGGTAFPDLMPHGPELVWTPVKRGAVDEAGAECALQLVRDIVAVLDDFAQTPPRLLKAGGLGVREVRRAAKLIGRTERDTARLIELATMARLLAMDPARELAVPTAAYDDWLAADGPTRWARLMHAWLTAEIHLSAAGAPDLNGKLVPPMQRLHGEPAVGQQCRRALAAFAAANGRIDHASLRARLYWEAPLLWDDASGGPDGPEGTIDWCLEETELLGICVDGALTTAGRLLARGEPAAAALTPYAPPVLDRFVLQADLTAIAGGELSRPVRTELELLADLESAGSATVYRFSPSSLRRGFDAGYTEATLLAFLDKHASHGVPQPLSYLVGDLARRFGRLRIGTARCFVRADDAALAAEVAGATSLARLGLRQIAPTVLVCDAEPAAAIEKLRGAGYLPARVGADGALVLSRPSARRLPPAGSKRTSAPAPAPRPVDLAAVVARLRKAGIAGSEGARAAATTPGARAGRKPPPVGRHLRAVPDSNLTAAMAHIEAVFAGRAAERLNDLDPFEELEELEELDALDELDELDLLTGSAKPSAAQADEPPRPSAIAHGRTEITALLELACEYDWLVRLAVSRSARPKQPCTVVVLAIADDTVHLETIDDDEIAVTLDRIEWARVLTRVEEDQMI